HCAVHSGPEPERHTFDAVVSERDLRESYLPHFEAGIREGGAYSLMCAYNRVDGKAACGSDLLLEAILRGEWGFKGYVVSDCGAIDDIYARHKVVATAAQAAALAVKTGTDLECGHVYANLGDAVRQGLVTEQEMDTSLKRLFLARFKLGMFDPPDRVRWARIPAGVLDQPAHRAVARQAARESIVLLKDAGGSCVHCRRHGAGCELERRRAACGPEPRRLRGTLDGCFAAAAQRDVSARLDRHHAVPALPRR